MKLAKALLVLALVAVASAPAFAETQNVKVSGSIDIYGLYRDNFDLSEGNDAGSVLLPGGVVPAQGNPGGGTSTQRSEADAYFMSITQVQVAADLTDNVSTVINLINMRDWNSDNSDSAEFDIDLDLAYVQMKEIFYAPLTLTIGRQDLVFGRGFIVGWNPSDPNGAIQADEFSQALSFDAVRATLDFNPWTLDFVYSKITENADNPENDRDLWIAYVSYKFAEYNAVAEGYYFGEIDKSTTFAAATGTRNNDTHTFGGRVQFDPISQMTLGAELAFQLGNYSASNTGSERDREAWATDLFGEYRWDNPWKPMLGLQYVYLSGEDDLGATTSADYGAWNAPFRLPVYGWIHDYLEIYYATLQSNDQPAGQNQQQISVYGSLNPLEDLKLTAAYWYFWTTEDVHSTAGLQTSPTLSDGLGHEIDLAVIYSYTEDVTFTFMANWFIPGDLYVSPFDETASEFISEVKVTF